MKPLIMKSLGWVALSQGATLVRTLVFGAILARLIPPSEFGIMGMVATFSGVVALFRMQSFGSALIQKQDITEDHKSSLFWLNLGAGLLLALTMVVLAPWVGKFYNNARVVPIARFLAMTFVISSLSAIHVSLLTKTMNFRMLSLVDMTSSFIASVCAILLAIKGLGVWSLVWQAIIQASCRLLLLWSFSGWRPRFLFRYRCIRDMLGFSVYLQASSLLNYANRNLDNILIGRFLGSEQLAYYNRAYQLMRLPQRNLSSLLARVFFPVFSAVQNEHDRIRQMYLRATRYVAVISFPLAVGLMIVAPEFITLLYGPRWNRTIFPFQVMALVGARQSVVAPRGAIYLSQGRTDIQFYMRIFSFTIIALAFIIGMRWNIEGVAIAYAIAQVLIMFPSDYVGLWRLIGLRLRTYYGNFIPMAVSSAVMGGVVWGVRHYLVQQGASRIVTLAGCAAVGSVVYLGFMFLIARPVLRELMNLLREAVSLKNAKTEIEGS